MLLKSCNIKNLSFKLMMLSAVTTFAAAAAELQKEQPLSPDDSFSSLVKIFESPQLSRVTSQVKGEVKSVSPKAVLKLAGMLKGETDAKAQLIIEEARRDAQMKIEKINKDLEAMCAEIKLKIQKTQEGTDSERAKTIQLSDEVVALREEKNEKNLQLKRVEADTILSMPSFLKRAPLSPESVISADHLTIISDSKDQKENEVKEEKSPVLEHPEHSDPIADNGIITQPPVPNGQIALAFQEVAKSRATTQIEIESREIQIARDQFQKEVEKAQLDADLEIKNLNLILEEKKAQAAKLQKDRVDLGQEKELLEKKLEETKANQMVTYSGIKANASYALSYIPGFSYFMKTSPSGEIDMK